MNERLIRWLEEKGYITPDQANVLRTQSKESGKSARELIMDQDLISDDLLLEALSAVSRIPTVQLIERSVAPDVMHFLRPDILRAQLMVPFDFDAEDSGAICVAMADPMNMKGRDLLATASKCRVRPFLATPSEILIAIDRSFGNELMEGGEDLLAHTAAADDALTPEEQAMQADIESSPVVVLVRNMVEQAVRQRASDIHIEPEVDCVRVRCRVDGVLYSTASYDSRLLSAIVARVKIMSGLDISEKRKPQDGRLTVVVDGREYDVRVSTLPTVYGEKVVVMAVAAAAAIIVIFFVFIVIKQSIFNIRQVFIDCIQFIKDLVNVAVQLRNCICQVVQQFYNSQQNFAFFCCFIKCKTFAQALDICQFFCKRHHSIILRFCECLNRQIICRKI